jgi:hypothetical protein
VTGKPEVVPPGWQTRISSVLDFLTRCRLPITNLVMEEPGYFPTADYSPRKIAGNSLLRFLLVEAAQAAARTHPDWRRRYMHLAMRRHKSIARVAMGRKLGVRLYWMWRNGCEYSQSLEFGSYAGKLGTGHGVK